MTHRNRLVVVVLCEVQAPKSRPDLPSPLACFQVRARSRALPLNGAQRMHLVDGGDNLRPQKLASEWTLVHLIAVQCPQRRAGRTRRVRPGQIDERQPEAYARPLHAME